MLIVMSLSIIGVLQSTLDKKKIMHYEPNYDCKNDVIALRICQ